MGSKFNLKKLEKERLDKNRESFKEVMDYYWQSIKGCRDELIYSGGVYLVAHGVAEDSMLATIAGGYFVLAGLEGMYLERKNRKTEENARRDSLL